MKTWMTSVGIEASWDGRFYRLRVQPIETSETFDSDSDYELEGWVNPAGDAADNLKHAKQLCEEAAKLYLEERIRGVR